MKMKKRNLILMIWVFAAFTMTWGTGDLMAQEKATSLPEWTGQTTGDFQLSNDITLTSGIYLTGNLSITAASGSIHH